MRQNKITRQERDRFVVDRAEHFFALRRTIEQLFEALKKVCSRPSVVILASAAIPTAACEPHETFWQVFASLETVGSWNFDTFYLSSETNGKPLCCITCADCSALGLLHYVPADACCDHSDAHLCSNCCCCCSPPLAFALFSPPPRISCVLSKPVPVAGTACSSRKVSSPTWA